MNPCVYFCEVAESNKTPKTLVSASIHEGHFILASASVRSETSYARHEAHNRCSSKHPGTAEGREGAGLASLD